MMITLIMTELTFREVFKFSNVNTANKTLMFSKTSKTEDSEKIPKVARRLNSLM